MLFNFLWKPKYSVWPEIGGCAFLRVEVLVDMHQIILTTGKSVFFSLASMHSSRKGVGKAVREKMRAADSCWNKTGSGVGVN